MLMGIQRFYNKFKGKREASRKERKLGLGSRKQVVWVKRDKRIDTLLRSE